MSRQRWGRRGKKKAVREGDKIKRAMGLTRVDKGAQRRVRLVRGKLFVSDRRYTNHVVT